MPHFIRADELARGEIRHAMFFALPPTPGRPGRLRPRLRRHRTSITRSGPGTGSVSPHRCRMVRPGTPNGWSPKGSTGTA